MIILTPQILLDLGFNLLIASICIAALIYGFSSIFKE